MQNVRNSSSNETYSSAPPAGLPPILPLYVDLDGSLVHSDLLIESAIKFLRSGVGRIILLLLWLIKGKANLKAALAARIDLNVALLPYNLQVVDYMRDRRARGGRIVLATASNIKYANAVAAHLGLFDSVIASDDDHNMSGNSKLAAIQRDSLGPFEYVGNEVEDLQIWRGAAAATVVNSGESLVREAAKLTVIAQHMRIARLGIVDWLRMLRIHQWAKNVLLFLPAMPLLALLTAEAWLQLSVAFVAFSLCASSVYLLNDLFDLDSDRAHARKRGRAIPSGRIPLVRACMLFPLLLVSAFALAMVLLPWQFVAVLSVYWISTLAYSIELKRRVLVDIMTLALLYTFRVLAGSAVILIAPSFWILAFSMFLFLSLAAAKRYVELAEMMRRDGASVAGRGYLTSDIPFVLALGVASGLIAILVFALYINDPAARAHLRQPYALWPICPLLLYWIARVWLKATRGELHDDPVVFAITDRISLYIAVLCTAFVFLAAGAL